MDTGEQGLVASFKFLKSEGGPLPKESQSLFSAAFALTFVSSGFLLLANDLAVEPLADMVSLDVKALINGTDPSSTDYARLLQDRDFRNDALKLMLAGAAYFSIAAVVDSVVRVIALFATVAARSGQQLTFGALLVKARAQLKGPLLTLAFVYALEIAYVALLSDMVALLVFLFLKSHGEASLLLMGNLLLLLAASVLLMYFTFLCAFSVVVAEPGCHGAGAVRRTWRLLTGRRRRGAPFTVLIGGLVAASSLVHSLARTRGNLLAGPLLWLLRTVLMTAVYMFALGTITAFYYECKESAEVELTEFVALSTEELIDA